MEDFPMKRRIKTVTTGFDAAKRIRKGCGECQTSCQSACKTSCGIANQSCEQVDKKAKA